MKISTQTLKYYNLLEKEIKLSDTKKLKKVFDYAYSKYLTNKHNNWDLIINNSLKAALLLVKISNDIDLLYSCLLRNILNFSSEEKIEKEFWKKVFEIIINIKTISNIKYNECKTKEKLLIFYQTFKETNNDIRAILIKICLRVSYVQNIWMLSNKNQKNIANETLDIYIPLIKNLSLVKYFPNIEDLCYQYINPNEYKRIKNTLEEESKDFKKKIKQIEKTINKIAKKKKISIEITSRIKSIYSISKKMENKKIPLSWIYDLIALCIITKKKRDTYFLLWLIHSIYKTKENRIKDYISSPKKNWYQSIHTTVSDNEWYIFEIQIQTKEMYEFNLFWIAAHNSYKWYFKKDSIFPEWFKNKNKKNNISVEKTFINSFDINIFTNRITCLTNRLDKIELPKDSTILDFAFKIHSKMWHRVNWAWINWEYVNNIVHCLKNWDHICLSLSEKQLEYPIEYLSFLKTNTAKKSIKNTYKNKTTWKIQTLWKHLLDEEMTLFWYKTFNKIPLSIQKTVLNTLKINDYKNLCLNIGNWKISINNILNIIYNLKDDNLKYKTTVKLKISFKKKSTDNINALFNVFHNLNINIININYKWIYIESEINVKNISLLSQLLIELSRMPNIFKVKRVMNSKVKNFIGLLLFLSVWIIWSPIILIFSEEYDIVSENLFKIFFYINTTLFVFIIYLFKYIIQTNLPWLIKKNIFWIYMFSLNTFSLITIIWQSFYIYNFQNTIFLLSLILVIYWLTLFEFLDSKDIKKDIWKNF